MFVKASGSEILEYPYKLENLKRDYPHITFPDHVPEHMLADYQIYEVFKGSRPAAAVDSETLMQNSLPTLRDGKWFLDYSIVQTPEEIASENVRHRRENYLVDCDWVVIRHQELGTAIPEEWLTYRQLLRDVPAQEGFPYDITWPTKPET